MESPLKQTFVDAFNNTFLPLVGGGETVVNGTNSTQGIVEYITESELGDQLVKEQVTGECRVVADSIGTMSYSTMVKIGTRTVFVTSQQIDVVGAINTFRFTSTRPALEGDTL